VGAVLRFYSGGRTGATRPKAAVAGDPAALQLAALAWLLPMRLRV
jgi:hypothetical protein